MLTLNFQMKWYRMESSQSGRVSADCWWHFCRNKACCLFQVCLKRVCIATGVYSRVRSRQYSWNAWVIIDGDYKQFFSLHRVSLLKRRRKAAWEKCGPCVGRHQAAFCHSVLVVPSNSFVNPTLNSLMVFFFKTSEKPYAPPLYRFTWSSKHWKVREIRSWNLDIIRDVKVAYHEVDLISYHDGGEAEPFSCWPR